MHTSNIRLAAKWPVRLAGSSSAGSTGVLELDERTVIENAQYSYHSKFCSFVSESGILVVERHESIAKNHEMTIERIIIDLIRVY